MNHYENAHNLAPADGDAKPKIDKIEPNKFDSVCRFDCTSSEMKMGLANDSVLHGAASAKDEGTNKKKKKYYMRQRYHRKYLKFASITIGVIVVIIFITLLAVLLKNGSSTKSSDTPLDCKLVMLTKNGSLLMSDPETKNSTVIFDTISPSATSFDMHIDQRIYWTEGAYKNRLMTRVNGSTSVLIDDKRFHPKAIAVDHVSENLYAVDGSAGIFFVLSIRTGEYALLPSDLHSPDEIVLDPEEGLMFICDGITIVRARMDGTEVITVVNDYVKTIAIDRRRKRLYWIVNVNFNIMSSDYDGHALRFFSPVIHYTSSFAIIDDKLYWLDRSTLFACEIATSHTCETYSTDLMMSYDDQKYVGGYCSTSGKSIKNPCEVDNGGCQQLCLPAGKNTRSCACRMGWQINDDKRSCHEVRDILIYPQDGSVHVKSIDGASKDLVWPTRYNFDLIGKGEIDFDYDMKNDDFYWSDDFHIYRMKLKKYDGNSTIILSVNQPNTRIQDITYDWYTGNMYFVQRHSDRHTLMMFNVNLGEKHRKTLKSIDDKVTYPIHTCPSTLSLRSARNSRFFACKRIIQRASMNNTSLVAYRLIAVDYEKDRIYWISDSDLVTTVKHSNFDGSDVRNISVKVVTNCRAIDVHDRWLFIGNSSSIWRVDKETGEGAVKIASSWGDVMLNLHGFKVISEKVQMSGDGNRCAEGNGGCEQFCLREEGGPNCMCEDNMVADGFKCLREL